MFKRRDPLTLLQTISEFLWPSMGWKRSFFYARNRLVRLSDTTHNIALGLSIGMGVSFTPLLGTHFIQAGIISGLFRGNIFSAMLGTFVGNPWTFPFFWWGGFSLGRFFFEILGIEGATSLPQELTFSIIWDMMQHEPLTLFLPWMLGGYLLLFITMPISYPIYYFLIKAAKTARAKAIAKRKESSS